jgi:ribonuclease P/MRP protein subunit POP5
MSHATSTFILRVPRQNYRLVWAALTALDHVAGDNKTQISCIFRVLRVSGTIRQSEEEAIRQAKQRVLQAQAYAAEIGGGVLSQIASQKDATDDMMDIVDASDYDDEGLGVSD